MPARMRMFVRTLVTLGSLVVAGVLVGPSVPAQTGDPVAQALVERVIAAHGGLEAWTRLQDLSFTSTRVTLTPAGDVTGARVSLHLLKRPDKSRVETLTGQGLLIEGFDGRRAWVTLAGQPDQSPAALTRAHFQAVNWWYWMGIPFKLKDPGVIVRHAGTATVQGQPVEMLDVTFRPGVGLTSDHFTYYVDPASAHIRAVRVELQPGVWPGVGGGPPSWSAWDGYRTVGPFTIHTRRIQYADPELTERRSIALFGDFRIDSHLPDRLFTAP